MVVRGAPAIGVTGALSLAVDLVANHGAGGSFASVEETQKYIFDTLDYLVTRCNHGGGTRVIKVMHRTLMHDTESFMVNSMNS
jgi:spore maturation protein SpmB